MIEEQRKVLLEQIGTGKTIVEVGCYLGITTRAIAKQGNKVIAIDPFIGGYDDAKDSVSKFLQIPERHDKILNTFLDNIKGLDVEFIRDTSENVLKTFNREVDGFFIDAEHTYKAMLIDVRWISKVKKGGLLCFHDYGNTFLGVKQAIDEFVIPFYPLIAQYSSLMIFRK